MTIGTVILLQFMALSNLSENVNGSLEIQPSTIDFGNHLIGEQIYVETEVFNKGFEPIEVKKVIRSCACASVLPASFVISPGKSVKLKIEIDTPLREQRFSNSIWLPTNENNKPYEIIIKGNIVAADHQLVTNLSDFFLGTMDPNSSTTRVISISRNGDVDIGKVKISSSKDWITVKSQRYNKKTLRLYVTVAAPKNIHVINEEILIKGSNKKDLLRVPVRGTVSSLVKVSPEFIMVEPNKSKYILKVVQYDHIKRELTSHKFIGKGLDLDFCVLDAGGSELVVGIKKQSSFGHLAKGKLILQFEKASEPININFISP